MSDCNHELSEGAIVGPCCAEKVERLEDRLAAYERLRELLRECQPYVNLHLLARPDLVERIREVLK